MKLEVFTEILNKIRKQSDKLDALYKLEIDLINYSDNYTSVIDILLKVYYGEDGTSWIDEPKWFCPYFYKRELDFKQQ